MNSPSASPSPGPSTPGPSTLSERARRAWPLGLVLLFTLLVHAWVAANEPPPALFEDEPHYNLLAHEDRLAGELSLLPGKLRFDMRPELISRVWAQLLPDEGLAGRTLDEKRLAPETQRRARHLNLGLFLVLLILVYAQARELGLSKRGSTFATALLAVFPWFGFYVHTLWPEILHACLASAAFLGILRHLRSGGLLPLLLGGLAAGWALLAKAALNPFLPVILILLAIAGARAKRTRVAQVPQANGRPDSRSRMRAIWAPLAFAGSVLLVIGPQLLANARAGHGYRLAGNRWKNIEMGLRHEPREQQTPSERRERWNHHLLYMSVGPTYAEREAAAEERVREYVSERGIAALASQQWRKFTELIFVAPSFFERALAERWGDPPPAWLAALRRPGRLLWLLLLGLGLPGVLLYGWRSPGHLLFALFVLYFFAALFVIPYKLRFAMPLIPVLCIFSASTVAGALSLRRPR